MAGWQEHHGQAVVLARDNVDTDQLIPARFMSTPRSEGYGQYLLHDLRQTESGAANPDFPLNQMPNASVLIAGRNFGSGSSREAAVYALVDAGFRAVIAPSFGDIFAGNAVNNGLLPAKMTDADTLGAMITKTSAPVAIDLQDRSVTVAGQRFTFELSDSWQTKLIKGWDDIDLTQQHADTIRTFRAARIEGSPWALPNS